MVIETAAGNLEVKFNEKMSIPGPSGAMTTTMAFVDAALGISDSIAADVTLESTMRHFRQFQPWEHAQRIATVANTSQIRPWVQRCNNVVRDFLEAEAKRDKTAFRDQGAIRDHEKLERTVKVCDYVVDAYDDAVLAATEWRMAHVDHVLTYIVQYTVPEQDMRAARGTGGTPISSYLCHSGMGTMMALMRPTARHTGSVQLPALCVAQCALEKQHGGALSASPLCARLWNTFDRLSLRAEFHDDSKYEDVYTSGNKADSGSKAASGKQPIQHRQEL